MGKVFVGDLSKNTIANDDQSLFAHVGPAIEPRETLASPDDNVGPVRQKLGPDNRILFGAKELSQGHGLSGEVT